MTIASCVETEKELDVREAHHMCPEKALAQLLAHLGLDLPRTPKILKNVVPKTAS